MFISFLIVLNIMFHQELFVLCVVLQAEELSPGFSKKVRLYIAQVNSHPLVPHMIHPLYNRMHKQSIFTTQGKKTVVHPCSDFFICKMRNVNSSESMGTVGTSLSQIEKIRKKENNEGDKILVYELLTPCPYTTLPPVHTKSVKYDFCCHVNKPCTYQLCKQTMYLSAVRPRPGVSFIKLRVIHTKSEHAH